MNSLIVFMEKMSFKVTHIYYFGRIIGLFYVFVDIEHLINAIQKLHLKIYLKY